MSDGISLDAALKIGEIVVMIGSVAAALFTVGRTTTRVEMVLASQSVDITDMKIEVRKLSDLLTAVALQKQRLDMIASQVERMDQRWEDMRHGRGFVMNQQP